MTAASRVRMHGLERNGDKRAKLVNRLLSSRGRLIGAMLLGNTIVNIGFWNQQQQQQQQLEKQREWQCCCR
jgi:Mg2+/Co2+ transporter CorB